MPSRMNVEAPAALLELVREMMSDWNKPLRIDQPMVDRFTKATFDENPAHKEGWAQGTFDGPIVPGMMLLSVSHHMIDGGLPAVFGDRGILFHQVLNFDSQRRVYIGSSVQIRFRVSRIDVNRGSYAAVLEFEMREFSKTVRIATGAVSLTLA